MRVPYRVPDESDLPDRLRAVLAVVYLVFNEGYTASSGERLIRDDLCAEAIRLGRLLAALMPDEPEVMGLLALMLLVESRRGARPRAGGRSCFSPTRTARRGTPGSSPRDRRSSAHASGATSPGHISCRPRSMRSTAMLAPRPAPTGCRSCGCTTSCCRSPPTRSSRSTARSRSPSSMGPRRRSRWWRISGSTTIPSRHPCRSAGPPGTQNRGRDSLRNRHRPHRQCRRAHLPRAQAPGPRSDSVVPSGRACGNHAQRTLEGESRRS